MRRSLFFLVLAGICPAVFAQAPAGNLVTNGDFIKFSAQENLWDGVDAGGFLCGVPHSTSAVTNLGNLGAVPMPVSVNFVDINGDGLPDLMMADPTGFFYAYINSGTKTAPQFTNAELVPLYFPKLSVDQKDETDNRGESTAKIALYDWGRRGVYDLLFGNYAGNLVMIRNMGGTTAPVFPQPPTYAKALIPTTVDDHLWGNLFAPCVFDWNHDGRPDVLIGEGSYSANAVYVLLNQAGGSEPKFTKEARYYLCYGDGREQLTPTVVDYNGDGEPDVLVGDRGGTIGVYLNPGAWKPGTELPLNKLLTFGKTQKLEGGAVAPYAADYNGDGLFDLLIGKANGHVALAINTGTKTEPKFDSLVDIKGVNLWANNIRTPSAWSVDYGYTRGNLYGYISVDDEKSPNGGKVLKAGFFPPPNKVFKMHPLNLPGRDVNTFFREANNKWMLWVERAFSDPNTFSVYQKIEKLKIGATYDLSFKIKGKNLQNGVCSLAYLGDISGRETVESGGERGTVKVTKGTDLHEEVVVKQNFKADASWAVFNKTIQVAPFRGRELKGLDVATIAVLEFKFMLTEYDGECDISDVQLTPK